jgi:hypothetical protein
VVVSPTVSLPEAMSRKRRRMILPERVFGSASVKRISLGFAIAPICRVTWSSNALASAPSARALPRGVTKATIAVPVRSSGRPTTAASATFSCETSALSTSMLPIRWPATFITSSMRPMIQK